MAKIDFKSKCCCWLDNGLFVDYALRYAPEFGRTLYWTPWVSSFPTSNSLLVGDGFDSIERIKHIWDYVDQVDLWIVPDVYFSDIQVALVNMGKRVFGARTGEDLELYREGAKKVIAKSGLPVADWKQVVGLDALREYLKENENQWVKVSTVRGDFETFHAPTYELIEPRLDELEWKLGAKKDIYQFVVEGGLDDCVEIGYDGWTIDGKYPSPVMTAYEIKDLGMLGTVKAYDDLPEPVRLVNAKLEPYFKKHKYRGFFASELRVGRDGVPFLIDPCCRCGTPSNELLQEFFTNWPEIWWHGAEGTIIEPEQAYKFGVIAMIHSAWSDKNWQAISFPDDVRQWVKLRNHTRILGKDYVVPTAVGLPEIGAVVGVGETIEEAISHLAKNASQIEGYQIEIQMDSITKAIDAVNKGEEFGMKFSDEKMPDPETLAELVKAEA